MINTNRHDFTFSFIERKVRDKTFGILTTINQDGTPHTTGVLYGVSPPSSKFSLLILTSKKYKKVRNIRINPDVSFLVLFPISFLPFVPSRTVTFNGKAELAAIDDVDVRGIFSKKRIHKMIIKEIETQETDSFTFIRIIPNPKVLCFGLGYNALKLRKGHGQGGYSVIILQERLV